VPAQALAAVPFKALRILKRRATNEGLQEQQEQFEEMIL
jgi:hypothetical protein